MVRIVALLASCLAILLSGPPARGQDKSEFEFKAKAALAIAKARSKVTSAAPAPHEAGPMKYDSGYQRSVADQKPLVVFVRCEPVKCEGAICSKYDADTFGEYKAPIVVVGFPPGGRLSIDSTLKCPASQSDIEKAVRSAAKKIDTAPAVPMPRAPNPKPYRIATEKPGCICGDECKCKPGECPSKCPVQQVVDSGVRTDPPPVGKAPSPEHEWGLLPDGSGWGWRFKPGTRPENLPPELPAEFKYTPLNQYYAAQGCSGSS